MKSYVGFDDGDVPDKSITVHEHERAAIVKYPKPSGGYFRVRVVQKPNPIGFHARLPGRKSR